MLRRLNLIIPKYAFVEGLIGIQNKLEDEETK